MRGRSVLRGPRVLLRPPHAGDQQAWQAVGLADTYRARVYPSTATHPALTPCDVAQWYDELCTNRHTWVLDVGGHCIGSASLRPDTTNRRLATYTIGIFNAALWGHGYGTEATRLVLAYAFGRLRLRAVGLTTRATNRRAIACYTKCGFVPLRMERDGGRTYLAMGCFNPHRRPPARPEPTLLIRDVHTLARTGQLTLRPVETAYLGIAPGDPVTTEVIDGVVIVQPAHQAPEVPSR